VKYLLDASAIAILLRRLRDKALNLLIDAYTLDLARYELGNVLWKEAVLRHRITSKDALSKAGLIIKLLSLMNIVDMASEEDYGEVLELAIKHKLTFYDASYLQAAMRRKLTLVTEDEILRERALESGINALSIEEYMDKLSRSSGG